MATALKTETLVVLGIALAAIYMTMRVGKAVAETAEKALPYVNPADDRNVVNQAATSLWQWASGSTGSIGGDLYDATHGGILSNGTFNPTSDNNFIYRNLSNSIGGDLGSKVYDTTHDGTLNPASSNNVIYRNVSDWAGGDLGSKIYDWLH